MEFTIQQYRNLSYLDNHKIIRDGRDFWWYSRKDTQFTKHCIISFTDYKKVLSNINYWIPIYRKRSINHRDCLDTMIKELQQEEEIYIIANSDTSLTNKIRQILKVNPSISPKELTSLLGVSKMTISRQLKLFR
jgi:hypothetical protein